MDDAELLRRYVNVRSQEAIAELVGRHVNLVYLAALRHLNGDVHRAKGSAGRRTQLCWIAFLGSGLESKRTPASLKTSSSIET
jgi:hypothetical protein